MRSFSDTLAPRGRRTAARLAGIAACGAAWLAFASSAGAAVPGAPSTPDLLAASDTGRSASDDVTSATAPVFAGTVGDAPAGAIVRLYVDDALAATGVAGLDGGYLLGVDPLAPLGDGTHSVVVAQEHPLTLEVLASDALAVTVDTTAPAIELDGPQPAPLSNAADVAVGFTAEADADTECRLAPQSADFAACAAPAAFAGLMSGAYTFEARATDAAGNAATVTLPFTIDRDAPPAPELTGSVPGSPGATTTPRIGGTTTAGTTVRLYADAACAGDPRATGAAETFAWSGLIVVVPPSSATTFWARDVDAAGNASPCSASSVTYVEDSHDPAAPELLSAPASPTAGEALAYDFAAEAGAALECSLLPAQPAWTACDSPVAQSYGGLAEGQYTFHVRATDAAGNTGAAATDVFVVDRTAPAAPALAATDPAGPANDNAPLVTGATEPGATVQLYLTDDCAGPAAGAGSAWALANGGMPVAVPDDRAVSIRATATDRAGNTSACSGAGTVYVEDSTAPEVEITAAPGAVVVTSRPEFAFASEDGATFECAIAPAGDAFEPVPCASPWGRELGDGDFDFRVRAVDAAGNRGMWAIAAVTVDPRAPVLAAPAGIAFGDQARDFRSAPRLVVLENAGERPLSVDAIHVLGPNDADFTTASGCLAPVAAGGSCTIAVRFAPTRLGAREAVLVIESNGGRADVALSGRGVPVPGPTVEAPVATLRPATVIEDGRVPVRLRWRAVDPTGIVAYRLEQRTGAGAWRVVKLPSKGSATVVRMLAPGAQAYRFRVTATNASGRSTTVAGAPFRVSLAQERAAAIAYAPGVRWSQGVLAGASGGRVRHTSREGTVRYTFTGSSVAWVSSTGRSRGKAEVWVDGQLRAIVDLYARADARRMLVTAVSGLSPAAPTTLELRALAAKNTRATGTRVDVDAFVVLAPAS